MTRSAPAELASGVQAGDVLAGKYRVERVLGAGGMGVVVAAHDEQLDRKVALKFLLPEVLGNAEAVGRFRREAQAAVKIKSEHVATVYEVGTLANGAPFIVMEYLEGGDLGGWLENKGALPVEQAVEFILQACEAIAEAHGVGIVHRDLKPSNLFYIRRADGILAIKVLDFGISKVTGSQPGGAVDPITRTSMVMGSPHYMSPEQLRSARDVDTRTDIWALGVILYQLLTGKPPFDCEAVAELFVKIMVHEPPPVRSSLPDLPEGIEAIIGKCLEKDRDKRYANVADFAVALAPYAPRRARASVERIRRIIQNYGLSTLTTSQPPSTIAITSVPAAQTDVAWGQSARPPSLQRKKWFWGSTAFVVAALGIGLLVWRFMQPAPRAVAAPQHGGPSVDIAPIAQPPNVERTTTAAPVEAAMVPSATPIILAPSEPSVAKTKSEMLTGAPTPRRHVPALTKVVEKPEPSASSRKVSDAPVAVNRNCEPNYTLDSEGRKHFKPECFQ